MSVTGDFSALRKLQSDLAFVEREAAPSCAEAVGVMLTEEIRRASIQVTGPSITIHRYLPRAAYLAPRLEAKAADIIDAHLAEMVTP